MPTAAELQAQRKKLHSTKSTVPKAPPLFSAASLQQAGQKLVSPVVSTLRRFGFAPKKYQAAPTRTTQGSRITVADLLMGRKKLRHVTTKKTATAPKATKKKRGYVRKLTLCKPGRGKSAKNCRCPKGLKKRAKSRACVSQSAYIRSFVY